MLKDSNMPLLLTVKLVILSKFVYRVSAFYEIETNNFNLDLMLML